LFVFIWSTQAFESINIIFSAACGIFSYFTAVTLIHSCVKNYERIFGVHHLRPTEIFAKRTMASICGRMALRAAARQNVAYTPVRFCKSKWCKCGGKSHGQLLFGHVRRFGGVSALELHNIGVQVEDQHGTVLH